MLNISCKACGKEVPADAKFCSGCAAPIRSQDSQQQPQQPPPIRQSAPTTTTLYANSVPPPPAYVFTTPAPPPPAASVAAAKPPPPPADVPPVGHPNAVSSVQAEEATSETLKREAAELERLEKLRIEKERLEQAQREEEARRLKDAERLELERKAQEAERIAQEQRYRARKRRERAEREQREREAAMEREREERESREAERERIHREMLESEQKQKSEHERQHQRQRDDLKVSNPVVQSASPKQKENSSANGTPRVPLAIGGALVLVLFLVINLKKPEISGNPSIPTVSIDQAQGNLSSPSASIDRAQQPTAPPTTTMPAAGVGLPDIGGNHLISLQWISWDYFGSISFSPRESSGVYTVTGGQKSKENKDYLRVEGTVVHVSQTELVFQGSIIISVSHSNGGEPCLRDGVFTFLAPPGRKYWRLQQMDNPCDQMTDYVDIYF